MLSSNLTETAHGQIKQPRVTFKLIKIKILVAVTWGPDHIWTGQSCGHPRGSAGTGHAIAASRQGTAPPRLPDRSREARAGILIFGLIHPTGFATPSPQIVDFRSVKRGPSAGIPDSRPEDTPARSPGGSPVAWESHASVRGEASRSANAREVAAEPGSRRRARAPSPFNRQHAKEQGSGRLSATREES